jgi:hypothetical protein
MCMVGTVKTAAALAALIVALLAAAPAAHAGWKIDRSLAIAQAVWNPACGDLRLSYGHPGDVLADAEGAAWAWRGNCTIGIDARMSLEFEELCTIVLHEAGHVTGAEHSDDPNSVMFAAPVVQKVTARISGRTVVRWDGIDRRCLDRGRPFLERHRLL